MLEITKGRSWEQYHTVLDSENGPFSDLTGLTLKSQIREKTATRNNHGKFEHKLVADVTVTKSGVTDSTIKMSLTRAQTELLELGDYIIDLLGIDGDDKDQSILDPEPIRVILRPTAH